MQLIRSTKSYKPKIISDLDLIISKLPSNFEFLSKDEFRKMSIGMTIIVANHCYNGNIGNLFNLPFVLMIKKAVNKKDKFFPIQDALNTAMCSKNCKKDIALLILNSLNNLQCETVIKLLD